MEIRHVVCGQGVVRPVLVFYYASKTFVSVCFCEAQRFIALSARERQWLGYWEYACLRTICQSPEGQERMC